MPLDDASFAAFDQSAKNYDGKAMGKAIAAIPLPEHLAIIRKLAEKEKGNPNLSFDFADQSNPNKYEYLITRNVPVTGQPGKTRQLPLLDELFEQSTDLKNVRGSNNYSIVSLDLSKVTEVPAK